MTSRGRSIKGTMKGDYVIMRERSITRIKGKAVIRRGSNGCFFYIHGEKHQKESRDTVIKRNMTCVRSNEFTGVNRQAH